MEDLALSVTRLEKANQYPLLGIPIYGDFFAILRAYIASQMRYLYSVATHKSIVNYWCFIALCLLFPFVGLTQSSTIDSLKELYDQAEVDTIKYDFLKQIVSEYEQVDRNSAIQYAKEKYLLAKKIDIPKYIANTADEIGRNYLYLGESDSAKIYVEEAIQLYNDLEFLYEKNNNLNNLALIHQRENRYEEAVATYQEVIVNADSLNDYITELFANVNLMSLFMDSDDYVKAVEYFRDIQQFYADVPPSETKVKNELNSYLSAVYLNAGQCFTELSMLDSAQHYLGLAEEGLDFIEDDFAKKYYGGYVYHSIGDNIYESLKRNEGTSLSYRDALEYFKKAQSSFETVGGEREMAITNNDLGKVYNKLGQLSTAKNYLLKGLEYSDSSQFTEKSKEGYEYLSENAMLSGNFKEAYDYLNKMINFQEVIRNEDRDKAINLLEVRFKTAEREKQIAELALENEIQERRRQTQQFAYGVSFLLFLGVAYAAFGRYRFVQQREKTEFERKINQAMSRFVPMDFIKAIGRERIQDVELGDQIEKEVTVVFTDIRSFTTLSEQMTPAENFAFVKEYAERMGPIIERNHGFISQYLGDGIMAIFQNNSNDALNACIEMQQSIHEYNQIREGRGEQSIKVGMGMHTGPLIMGIIGDEVRRDATLISDTVNTAARIESTTKQLNAEILLSAQSVSQISEDQKSKILHRGEVTVKGKTIPIPIYEYEINT